MGKLSNRQKHSFIASITSITTFAVSILLAGLLTVSAVSSVSAIADGKAEPDSVEAEITQDGDTPIEAEITQDHDTPVEAEITQDHDTPIEAEITQDNPDA